MDNLLCNDNFLVDRCLLDGFAYTRYLYDASDEQIPDWFMDYASHLLRKYMRRYDHIFYLPVEFELADDGVRSTNSSFRNEVTQIFESLLAIGNFTNVHRLSGTVEERAEKVLSIVRS